MKVRRGVGKGRRRLSLSLRWPGRVDAQQRGADTLEGVGEGGESNGNKTDIVDKADKENGRKRKERRARWEEEGMLRPPTWWGALLCASLPPVV